MPKISITISGITSNYNLDQEQSDQPQIECSNHEETLSLSFSAEQYRIYYNGGVAVAHDEDGREILCKSFSRK